MHVCFSAWLSKSHSACGQFVAGGAATVDILVPLVSGGQIGKERKRRTEMKAHKSRTRLICWSVFHKSMSSRPTQSWTVYQSPTCRTTIPVFLVSYSTFLSMLREAGEGTKRRLAVSILFLYMAVIVV